LSTYKFCLKIINCYKLSTVGKYLEDKLTKLAQDHPKMHFFCDETPIEGIDGLSTKFLTNFSIERIGKNVFLWIACNFDWPSQMEQTNLKKSGNSDPNE
jgi:hypothetical protein